MYWEVFKGLLENHRWKILGVIAGFIIGWMILSIGFFKTAFIFLCIFVGYYIGKRLDKNEDIRDILDKILPPGR